MRRLLQIITILLLTFTAKVAIASGMDGYKQDIPLQEYQAVKSPLPHNIIEAPTLTTQTYAQKNTSHNYYNSSISSFKLPSKKSMLLLFLQSLGIGLLAVFTPYVYTILPFTVGYLTKNDNSKAGKIRNPLIYALFIVLIFTILGIIVATIIRLAGLQKYTEHWVFNLFFFRIFVTLGLAFLGAFTLKLPEKWINRMSSKADNKTIKGIFYMALTLPGASLSSTLPIIGLVLMLAGGVPDIGPVIGMLGFSIGLSLPFVFPIMVNIFVRSKSLLNNIKVVMGFFSLMISLKFFSKADLSLGYHLLSRDMFIMIWLGLWVIMGVYMLGYIKLSHDQESEHNLYGQEYIPLSRLFIALFSITFALYLLPGIWGAPLAAVHNFLP